MVIRLNFKDKIPAILRNKYVLTIIIFIVWVTLLDSNNLIARYKEMSELRKLKIDREYYLKRIENDKQKLHELKTDSHNLEKFAREQYHMKKPDEDLYIILTQSEDRKITRNNR
jgi:cell division protein DivIC